MDCKFYLPPGRLNAVTSFYVDILKEAAYKAGFNVKTITNLDDISISDYVVTISDKDFYHVSRQNPAKQAHWFQGIIPEEAAITFKGHWTKWPRICLHRMLDAYILRHSDLNFYVSEAMKEHYARQYGKVKGNSVIMPCFNATLQTDAITNDRYKSPKFVYAGSLHRWQCFEPMLELFKKIKQFCPNATLDIFTAEKENALKIISAHGIDAKIDCLPPAELNKKLRKYKYGFIVREIDPVNYVASPTKMNTYMAAGIIPVASDVVETFRTNLSSCPYVILFQDEDDLISRIKKIEATDIDSNNLQKEFSRIFDSFWNRATYIKDITRKFKSF